MMTCSEVFDLIPKYCNGELDEEVRRQVEEHLAECPKCRTEVGREELMQRLIAEESSEDPPDEYWEDYRTRLRSRLRGATGILWRMGCLPGCLMGLIGSVLVFVLMRHSPHPPSVFALAIGVVIIGAAMGLLMRRVGKRALQRLQTDELSLRRLIFSNRSYRFAVRVAHFLFLLLVGGVLGAYMFSAFLTDRLPPAVSYGGAAAILIVYTIAAFSRLRSSELIPNLTAQNRQSPLWKRLVAAALVLPFLGCLAWNRSIAAAVNPPLKISMEADKAYERGDRASAISMLQSCIQRYGKSPRVLMCYKDLGDIYGKMGNKAEAKKVYRDGVRAYERLIAYPTFHYNFRDRRMLLENAAGLYHKVGQDQRAREALRTMLELAPKNAENVYFTAEHYAEMGDKEEAKRLYTVVILKFPGSMWAQFARSDLRRMR